jgi:hypothetical protein
MFSLSALLPHSDSDPDVCPKLVHNATAVKEKRIKKLHTREKTYKVWLGIKKL